ncbi:MopE-related protein [Pyxidicoccus sp. MSG2]|uniref:MopE-related protein n=1 Tax=Pyxidicoccus sp. MSG2 TaxID=2996790 RepID=UPI0022702219|nr:MopE-related protein [Pyxidicoccus sp. MSG2]MCY1018616.1 MopE-related protein [Pyxidicoccus sp. MSG2]
MSRQDLAGPRSRLTGCVAVLLFAAMGCGEPEPLLEDGSEAATTRHELTSVKVPQTVAAGAYHSLFLKKDGEVWTWGQNVAGQLGTGSTSSTPQSQPSKVNGLPAIKAIAAGIAHSVALDVSGNVWVWGQNANGQAGLGIAGGTVLVPTKVAALSSIQAITANGNFSLALGTDGRLWAWGQNASGQVGTGATSASVATPTVVQGLPTLQTMAAGVNHALALDVNGKVWGWGLNTSGQVGTGSTSATVLTPTQATGLPRAKAVAAGVGHSLIVDEQFGNVWAWGQNTFGQVGTGSTSATPVLAPTPVSGVFAVTAIAAGHNSSLVIIGNGLVKAWGHNASGQLGNSSTANSASAVSVTGLANAKAIAAGAQHSLALRPGCPVWAWGNNGQGQLGTGTTSTTATTAPVSTLLINTFYFDGDMDGFGDEYIAEQACDPSPGFVEELDCDDYTPTTFPGAPELCNGMDDSCDGVVDDGNPSGGEGCATGKQGVCAAGTTACADGSVVCQQNQAASAEQCDNLDNDCDGVADEGNPGGLATCATGQQGVCGEGVTYCTHGAIECVQKEPSSAEVCDSKDNDCNGQSDDGLTFQAWYRDQDGDNYGLASQSVQACARPTGYSSNPGDCDDTQSGLNPGATEVCDGADNDCDTQVDEGLPAQAWYRDQDGDGFGNGSQSVQNCRQPAGYVAVATDCNDGNGAIKPGAAEVCDGVDNDCDTQVDEGLMSTWYRDADGDGHGNAALSTQACAHPTGYVSNSNDCNDSNAAIKPGATEVCDSVDNNCSGAVDEGLATMAWYRDADGDTYGTSTNTLQKCSQPAGYVSNASDCNDGNGAIKPGATEVCDGTDNNCNGSTDEGVGGTWYRDADGDGYGNAGLPTQACSQPSGYVSNSADCNDASTSTRPGASEVCDGADNNCNGSTDEGVLSTYYRDSDGDGYGNTSSSTAACGQPGGYVSNASDCNDNNASIRPGATEVCDSVDNNCSGQVDEGVGTTWHRDADGDNYGDPNQSVYTCSQPAGYVLNNTDCNDGDTYVRPGMADICPDGIDNNCNGQADEPGCQFNCELACGGACIFDHGQYICL